VQHQAIAGFLGAVALAHATVAGYSLFLYSRATPADAGKPTSRRSGSAGPASARPSGRDPEPLVFGLLNIAVVAFDGGLARAYGDPARLGPWLALAGAGRIAAAALLVHFVLQYARVRRLRWAVLSLHAVAVALIAADLAGLAFRNGEARIEPSWIAGAPVDAVVVPATPLGLAFAAASVVGAFFALLLLGRAFLRGRREAVAFVGMTFLTVAALYDALRDAGLVIGPPIGPLGYAALVNGVMMTLISRFTALRGQLEDRARELKDKARALRRSYEELRAAQDELVRKEQLAAVGELSAVVAHEVRNPLAIIGNAVATLRRAGVSAEDRDVLLGILDEESSRLNRLVGDLLRYARPVALERQLISPREIIERGLALAEGRVDLTVELIEPEPLEKVWADPNLCRQVFDNLVDNAIQAMSGGGTLTITLVNLELDGQRGVEVQIQDTGEGMDTEVRARALDPFFTTRPSGTGLGLAIVARIIDAHGGVLRIKSKAGSGTVMHVFLPRSSESPEPRRSRSDRPSSEPPLPSDLARALGRSPR
jgi:signal transduction histidine kinase